jgi:hypothetical protein
MPPNVPRSASRPLPLDAKQTGRADRADQGPARGEEEAFLLDLLTHRVPPGVDDAAKVKASFLAAVAHGDLAVGLISKAKATELLGTMVGGYNVHPLIELLDDAEVGRHRRRGPEEDPADVRLLQRRRREGQGRQCQGPGGDASWADAEWFTSRPEVPRKITVTVFKVPGETNTDDLSPAPDAWSRPDIPLHYLAMLKNTRRRGLQARGRRQARPDEVHRGPEEEGPPGGLRGRRGRHRLQPQERHQQRDLGHRPGHPLRAEQALRRRHAGRQDRADLLQHAGRLRRAADRGGRHPAGDGRRDRHPPRTTARW